METDRVLRHRLVNHGANSRSFPNSIIPSSSIHFTPFELGVILFARTLPFCCWNQLPVAKWCHAWATQPPKSSTPPISESIQNLHRAEQKKEKELTSINNSLLATEHHTFLQMIHVYPKEPPSAFWSHCPHWSNLSGHAEGNMKHIHVHKYMRAHERARSMLIPTTLSAGVQPMILQGGRVQGGGGSKLFTLPRGWMTCDTAIGDLASVSETNIQAVCWRVTRGAACGVWQKHLVILKADTAGWHGNCS